MAYIAQLNSVDTVDHTPAADVAAGDIVEIGALLGVAKVDIAAGALGALALNGVYTVAKVTLDDVTAGDALYWDASAELLTVTATANAFFGRAAVDAGTTATSVLTVKINA